MGEQILYRDDSEGIYDEYSVEVSYQYDSGLLAMGRASNGPAPPVIVRTGSPVLHRVITFAIQRTGDDKPKIPDSRAPELSGGELLLKEVISPFIPVPHGDGTLRAWRVTGQYVYIVKNPFRPSGSALTTGVTPLDIGPEVNTRLPASSFDGTVLGSADLLRGP